VNLKICCGGDVRDKADYGCCANVNYLLSGFGCRDGEVMDRCGDEGLYNPALQFCAADKSTQWLCGGKQYDYPEQYCEDNVVKGTCGGEELEPLLQFCYDGRPYGLCGGSDYNPSSHFCSGNAPYALCGGAEYNPATHFCAGSAPYALCGGNEYNPETQFCAGGSVQGNCGEAAYDPQTQFCRGDAVYARCGGATYTASQFCQPGTNAVKELCGGNEYLATQFCSGGEVLGKCGGTASGAEYSPPAEQCCGSHSFNAETQFCHGSSKPGDFCGINPQKSYDPDLYECKAGKNGIYLKGGITDSRDGNRHYDAVLIDTLTWMAENLSYNASGSKCYAEGVSGVSEDSIAKNCATYGRLYNWATALDSGICPSGWHVPGNFEWNALIKFIGSGCRDYDYGTCINAIKLKATSGWSDDFIGTDDYGFAALPGACTVSSGSNEHYICSSNYGGYWWSASEYEGNGNYLGIYNNRTNVMWSDTYKGNLTSVRCVQD
jgi:uncharacterized protein (TIGR02145 family)